MKSINDFKIEGRTSKNSKYTGFIAVEDFEKYMKEYAAQFIELAAKEVGNHPCYYKENEGRNHDIKSILQIKEQLK